MTVPPPKPAGDTSRRSTTRQLLSELVYMLLGIALATVSMVYFLIPNKIVPGGLTGIGTILFHRYGVPIGVFVLLGNTLLIVIQGRLIGAKASGRTIAAIILQNLVLDLFTSVYSPKALVSDPMLACLYGGILGGLGLACLFRSGATTGGSEIIAQILLKLRGVPVGTTLWSADALVTLVAASAFGPELALFAMVKSYVNGTVVDGFLEGFAVKRLVLIVSQHAEAIGWGVIEELHRGATIINARGMYSGKGTEMLVTAITRHQIPFLERVVYDIDPNAFIIVTDARRIIGKGFEELETIVGAH